MHTDTASFTITYIIINHNTEKLTLSCIDSVIKNSVSGYEIIVFDNGSQEGNIRSLEKREDILFLASKKNLGFARACNRAFEKASGEFVCFINSDAELRTGVDNLTVFLSSDERAAAAGAMLLNSDGSEQNSFGKTPCFTTEIFNKSLLEIFSLKSFRRKAGQATKPFEVESLVGAFMVVKSGVFRELGGFDERYFFFFEESDFCLRMRRAGYKIFMFPGVKVVHFQGKTAGAKLLHARVEYYLSRYKYFRKHYGYSGEVALKACLIILLLSRSILYLAGNIATVFLIRNLRGKLILSCYLFMWHLLGLRRDWGLTGE
ncbi:MAG: glycosyltransferase family 2 protein [Candidatus Aureabacteria bacterium]|nr:glycosyltransferase family 2 protein [Candidatus Auribacterota bacterium]